MALLFGTDDGVWALKNSVTEQRGLGGRAVRHVAHHNGMTLATVAHDGLYALTESGERLLWAGDARSCGIAPDGRLYVGTEPAMVWRSDDGGET